ncbi:PIR Superfamily Protein [Plasmodium malariae]|uniref:PIR Superfamily Protein n=1 Tax=Plasmodium malariae TaxID=5858 RepID=A0A1A8WXC1_PLAMA|nr:PIR Superfamily Protein [Plasmodium malariae]
MENINEEFLNKLLEGSQSSNIYNKLNENVTGSQYDTICNVINESKNRNGFPSGSYDLCKQIARNADDLSKMLNKSGYNNQCLHYTYWIYYELKKILKQNSEDVKTKHIIKYLELKNNIYKEYQLHKCLPGIKDNNMNELNEKVDEKYLHDYFQNYDIIKTYSACERATFQNYKEYLTNISKLYMKHKKDKQCCDDPFWDSCPDYFKCPNEFDPNNLLQVLNSNTNGRCNNLKKLEKTSKSVYPMNSGGSQTDIISSFYFISCTDITDKRQKCNVFPSYPASMKNPSSSFTQHPPYHVTVTIDGQPRTSVDTLSQRERPGSTENSVQPEHLPFSDQLSLNGSPETKEKDVCTTPGYVKDSSGNCREPNVRETTTIELRINEYHPNKKRAYISFKNNSISSNTFNNFFRAGIILTLIVGIISIIFIYYKFTPFGICFRKKMSKKKGIHDYYDDPYMRHFIIRAPKSVKRKVGTKGLRFSYYSM